MVTVYAKIAFAEGDGGWAQAARARLQDSGWRESPACCGEFCIITAEKDTNTPAAAGREVRGIADFHGGNLVALDFIRKPDDVDGLGQPTPVRLSSLSRILSAVAKLFRVR